jgi:hypothetical protein
MKRVQASAHSAGNPGYLSRRRFLRQSMGAGLTLLAPSTVLAACSGADDRQAPGGNAADGSAISGRSTGTLYDFTYAGRPGSVRTYWRGLADRFNAATGASIGLRETTAEDLDTTVIANESAKKGEALQSMWPNLGSFPFFLRGSVVDLNELIAARESDQWLFKQLDVGGANWYAPHFPELRVLLANTRHLEAAGVDPEEAVDSVDNWISALDEVKASGQVPFMIATGDIYGGDRLAGMLVHSELDDPFTWTDFSLGNAPAQNEPQVGGWIDKMVLMRDRGHLNPDAPDITDQENAERFAAGEGAFTTLFAGAAIAMLEENEDLEVIPYVRGPGASYFPVGGAGVGYGITSFGENQEVAVEVLKFMHTPDELAEFQRTTGEFAADSRADTSGMSPATRSVWDLVKDLDVFYGYGDFLGGPFFETLKQTYADVVASRKSAGELKAQWDEAAQATRDDNPQFLEDAQAFRDAAKTG